MIIQIEDDFDIGKIAESGQCFRCSQSDGQYIILDRSAPTLTDLYHFRDLTKMIRNLNTTCFTGFHCTNNGFIKIFPSLIP